jgi:peptidoglycan hydrolase-like protein with peptidoglycan-binding domain
MTMLKYNAKKIQTGDAVKTCQTRLLAHGYNATVSGAYNAATYALVKAFQLAYGLKVDGVVGPKTWAALQANPWVGTAHFTKAQF